MAKHQNQKYNANSGQITSIDQLDKMITVVPAASWLAVLVGAIVVGGIILWSFLGRLPVAVETSGIYTYGDGVNSIYAPSGGIVSVLYAQNGDVVEEGDLIAAFKNDEVQKKIDDIEERKIYVEAVTMDSVGDIGTADNKDMLNLKSQLLTVDDTKNADELLLADKENELADQNARVIAAKDAMDAAQELYYAGLNEGSSTLEQLRMGDAQNEISVARNKLASAKSDYQNAKGDIAQAKNDVTLAKNDVASAKGDLDRLNSDISYAKSDLASEKMI